MSAGSNVFWGVVAIGAAVMYFEFIGDDDRSRTRPMAAPPAVQDTRLLGPSVLSSESLPLPQVSLSGNESTIVLPSMEGYYGGSSVPTPSGAYSGNTGYYSPGALSSSGLEDAKTQFSSAADDLRRAVRDLSHNDWSDQMGVIRRRTMDADAALSELERLAPNDPSVANARMELDQMQRNVGDLYHENWADVAPRLHRSSRNIESEAWNIESSLEPED